MSSSSVPRGRGTLLEAVEQHERPALRRPCRHCLVHPLRARRRDVGCAHACDMQLLFSTTSYSIFISTSTSTSTSTSPSPSRFPPVPSLPLRPRHGPIHIPNLIILALSSSAVVVLGPRIDSRTNCSLRQSSHPFFRWREASVHKLSRMVSLVFPSRDGAFERLPSRVSAAWHGVMCSTPTMQVPEARMKLPHVRPRRARLELKPDARMWRSCSPRGPHSRRARASDPRR